MKSIAAYYAFLALNNVEQDAGVAAPNSPARGARRSSTRARMLLATSRRAPEPATTSA